MIFNNPPQMAMWGAFLKLQAEVVGLKSLRRKGT